MWFCENWMGFKMGQIVKLNFSNVNDNGNIIYEHKVYEQKLIRIRDDIEDYLCQASLNEKDELAVALAAGRYAAMKLAQLTGEVDTKEFFQDCINTTLSNWNTNLFKLFKIS